MPKALRRFRKKKAELHATLDAMTTRIRFGFGRTAKRGLFIDCGSNLGQGFSFFRQHYPQSLFDYVLIEPNPNCAPRLCGLKEEFGGRIEIIHKAASTREGEAKFYGLVEDKRGSTSDGGSILRDHNSRFYAPDEENAITVRTFSLADFIQSRQFAYFTVVMKMDIEGAEYDVLEHLIANQAHKYCDFIYVEFHSQYMNEPKRTMYKGREAEIMKGLKRDKVRFRLWQ